MQNFKGRVRVRCPYCKSWQSTTTCGRQFCFSCGGRYVVSHEDGGPESGHTTPGVCGTFCLFISVGALLAAMALNNVCLRQSALWLMLGGLAPSIVFWALDARQRYRRGVRIRWAKGWVRGMLILFLLAFAIHDLLAMGP
ncbi:MAG: hypothetical protein JXR37_00300 [Kiritimatiellae bacterium]|nr:hypothetical protein [Kiritimatiellia bacterium]